MILISHPTHTQAPPTGPTQTQSYLSFFKSVAEDAHRTCSVSTSLLDNHGICVSPEPTTPHHYTTKTKVVLMNVERGASVVTYKVLLGAFIVNVKMLNIDEHIFE